MDFDLPRFACSTSNPAADFSFYDLDFVFYILLFKFAISNNAPPQSLLRTVSGCFEGGRGQRASVYTGAGTLGLWLQRLHWVVPLCHLQKGLTRRRMGVENCVLPESWMHGLWVGASRHSQRKTKIAIVSLLKRKGCHDQMHQAVPLSV